MSRLVCPACGEAATSEVEGRPVCGKCGWGKYRPTDPEPDALSDDDSDYELVEYEPYALVDDNSAQGSVARPKRKKRRYRVEPRRDFPAYAVAIGLLAAIWAALAWFAVDGKDEAYALAISGLFIAAVGMFLLYYEAAKEGAERVTLLNVVSTRSMIGMFVLALIELA
ncbi:MAG: hypothetical protein ACRCZF_27245, partial [Gemmataceae bacterium]